MLRTCNAHVFSFDYGSFAMQYAVACAVCLLGVHSDWIFFFQKVPFTFITSPGHSLRCSRTCHKIPGIGLYRWFCLSATQASRSRFQAIHKERLNLKIRRVGSSSVISIV